MSGQFVWYELMTSDSSSALKFYPAVTGWGTDEFDKVQNTMWTADDVPLGGVVQLTPEQLAHRMPSHWLPYISVDDVDASAQQAAGLGGRVLFGPQDIPGTGRFAVIADPQGASFAIYRSVDPSEGFNGTRRLGRFVWHELLTTNVDSAFDFYRKLFGWNKTTSFDMGPDVGLYQMFGKAGAEYGGMFKGSGRMEDMRPFWTCYVHVKDVKKAAEIAQKRGAQVVNGPMEVPGGDWIAVIMDPQGAAFAVHQNPIPTAKGAQKGAQKAAKKSARKSARKGAKKGAKKGARKGAAKAARKSGKKGARTSSGKSALRSARKGSKKAARKTARKKGRKR